MKIPLKIGCFHGLCGDEDKRNFAIKSVSEMLANFEGIGIFFSRLDVLLILPLLLILFVYELVSLMKSRKVNK